MLKYDTTAATLTGSRETFETANYPVMARKVTMKTIVDTFVCPHVNGSSDTTTTGFMSYLKYGF